ncbi:MAG: zinc chelation protein SecC [Candidatus Aegiribacteria sp.]|nr:zinc chelation protein SecC [Candidatus Aegiribacteria sp.]
MGSPSYIPAAECFCRTRKDTNLAKLGTAKRPIVVQVQSEEKARYVAEVCEENNWIFVLGMEPDKPEDLSDLERMLHPVAPAQSNKISRNSPCPCGSGKKYKKCCG